MKDKLFDVLKYYIAKFILLGFENKEDEEIYGSYERFIYYRAYRDSDLKDTYPINRPFFQTVSYDRILNEEQRDLLYEMFDIINEEIKHTDSSFNNSSFNIRFDFYNQIIEKFEKKSDFDYEKYMSMVGSRCFNKKYYSDNNALEKEFLKLFGIKDLITDKCYSLTYYYEFALQYFFIELFDYLIENGITKEFIKTKNKLMRQEQKDRYEILRKAIEKIRACCIVKNKKRIFNFIDCLTNSTSELKYYIDKKDEFGIKNMKGTILSHLKNCICDRDYLFTHVGDFTYWTIKYDDEYVFFDGKELYQTNYPAFFVRVDYNSTYVIGGYVETVNMISSIANVLDAVEPFIKKIGVDMEKISCELCIDHAELYSEYVYSFLFNLDDKNELLYTNEEKFVDDFEFSFFEY